MHLAALFFLLMAQARPAACEGVADAISVMGIYGGSLVTQTSSIEYLHTVRIQTRYSFEKPFGWGLLQLPLRQTRTLLCSGTLIGERAVLTAAHCFPRTVEDEGTRYPVHIDGHEIVLDDEREVSADRRALHPGYSFPAGISTREPNPVDDVAMLHLSASLPGKLPALLAEPGVEIPATLIIAGYGKTNDETTAGRLNSAEVPFRGLMQNMSDFWVGDPNPHRPDPVQNPVGICSGDSGGPVFIPGPAPATVVGVSNSQSGNCLRSVSIVADVRHYHNWINAILQNWLR